MAQGKKHTAEQVVNLPRQVEVGVANLRCLFPEHGVNPQLTSRGSEPPNCGRVPYRGNRPDAT
jgi:hypothetical protein